MKKHTPRPWEANEELDGRVEGDPETVRRDLRHLGAGRAHALVVSGTITVTAT